MASIFRFPEMLRFSLATPKSCHRLLCLWKDKSLLDLGISKGQKNGTDFNLEYDRSDNLALTTIGGIFLFEACLKCSGQSSLSTRMAKSGLIFFHALPLKGNQSNGNGP